LLRGFGGDGDGGSHGWLDGGRVRKDATECRYFSGFGGGGGGKVRKKRRLH
jgi:hypothetical protein